MKKIVLGAVAAMILIPLAWGLILSRDGELVTPQGEGKLEIAGSSFEAFPLPDYAASQVDGNYKSYFVEVEPGIKVHVLEVGSGYPVYMQHGIPTSGFLFRKVADQLPLDKFRVIMPTMIGLGFSSKTPAGQHSLENHVDWLSATLERLEIEDAIFVGHDWGGPIGMGVMAQSPDLMTGAVILNTTLDKPVADPDRQIPLQIAKTPIAGEILFEGLASIFSQLPSLQSNPESMGEDVIALYEKPVRDSGNSKGVLAIMRMAYDNLDDPSAKQLAAIYNFYRTNEFPVEIVWGVNDPLLGARLETMKQNFPDAPVTKTEAGHFLQEETPEEIADAIERVFDRINQADADVASNQES